MVTYLSGQGILNLGERGSNGYVKGYDDVGNAPMLEVQTEVKQVDHFESRSGIRAKDSILYTEVGAMLKISLDEFTAKNFGRMLAGTVNTVSGSSVTGETISSTGVVAGQKLHTKYSDISSVTVKDSAGSPATLTGGGTDYTIYDAKRGILLINNVSGFTQPFKVDYTYAAQTDMAGLTDLTKEYALLFEGIDTANQNQKFTLWVHKIKIKPGTVVALINQEYSKSDLELEMLYDADKANGTSWSGFFHIQRH